MLDIGSGAKYMDTWKQELWDNVNIGVPHLDIEANDSVIFGYLVCWFITEVSVILYHKVILVQPQFSLFSKIKDYELKISVR